MAQRVQGNFETNQVILLKIIPKFLEKCRFLSFCRDFYLKISL